MKILEVTPFFSPVHGGSAEVPYHLSKELAKRAHEVILYTSDSKLSGEYKDSLHEVRVHIFKTWSSLTKFYITPDIVAKAKKELKHFDIIHLHNYRTFQNTVVHHYAKKYSIPYVLQAHGSLPRMVSRQVLKNVYDNVWGYRLLRDASGVIAVTKMEAEQYRNMGVNEDRIEIIPHGIAPAEFANLPARGKFREKYGLGESEKMILYLGRIDKPKGLDLLAEAFSDLLEFLQNIKLVIVGPDDGYLRTLKRLLTELKIEKRVSFTGPLYEQEKLSAYIDSDVFVLPSSYEIFGITVLEACACGTPVIVTDHCGIAEAIEGQAGLVVPYDKDQLRDGLSHMLSDDRMRLKFSEKGKSLVQENFDWEKIAEQIENVYQRCRSI